MATNDAFDINALEPKEIKELIDKKISKFFSSCSVAFRAVDHPSFKDLVQTLIKLKAEKYTYNPPGRKRLGNKVLSALHDDLENQKRNHFEGTESILETDGWKNSNANKKFMVL